MRVSAGERRARTEEEGQGEPATWLRLLLHRRGACLLGRLLPCTAALGALHRLRLLALGGGGGADGGHQLRPLHVARHGDGGEAYSAAALTSTTLLCAWAGGPAAQLAAVHVLGEEVVHRLGYRRAAVRHVLQAHGGNTAAGCEYVCRRRRKCPRHHTAAVGVKDLSEVTSAVARRADASALCQTAGVRRPSSGSGDALAAGLGLETVVVVARVRDRSCRRLGFRSLLAGCYAGVAVIP